MTALRSVHILKAGLLAGPAFLCLSACQPQSGSEFFEPSGGGDPVMSQHLFWFFGHWEVWLFMGLSLLNLIGIFWAARYLKRRYGWGAVAAFTTLIIVIVFGISKRLTRSQVLYMEGRGDDVTSGLHALAFGCVRFAVPIIALVVFVRLVLHMGKPSTWRWLTSLPALYLFGGGLIGLSGGVLTLLIFSSFNSEFFYMNPMRQVAEYLVKIALFTLPFVMIYAAFERILKVSYRKDLALLQWALWTIGLACLFLAPLIFQYPQTSDDFGGGWVLYPPLSEIEPVYNWNNRLVQLGGFALLASLVLLLTVVIEARVKKRPTTIAHTSAKEFT